MKKISFLFVPLLFCLYVNGQSTAYTIGYVREPAANPIGPNNDSLFVTQAQVNVYDLSAISSIQMKYYVYQSNAFSLVKDTTLNFSNIQSTVSAANFDFYMLNENVVLINLGQQSSMEKHKVYIKITGTAGTVIQEAEL